ncbi:SpoIIE family protein phosphatase [Oryzihumus leptocrescens]|uniref:PAS domain S-box-containing protein n=1 Tax=Oryzihumus leptocrescens TaxID=297536 RepID=A0A542ZKG9_9MICO|nr:SpoIIE family protein phosphatase [Oryzihumus leptocrescens]TQL60845.1 PAS domain S-box-containing protein [Oryzihumus leptocrescens]
MTLPPSWRSDTALLDALGAAVIGADLTGTIFYCNAVAEALYGYTQDQLRGSSVMDLLVPTGGLAAAQEIMRQVTAGQRWTGEFLVRTASGAEKLVQITDSPLYDAGEVVGVLGVAEDVTDLEAARAGILQLTTRLNRLAKVTAELAAAHDLEGVTETVVSHAADAVGANLASLSLLEDEHNVRLVGFRGDDRSLSTAYERYSVSNQTPSAEAIRTGKPVVVEGAAAIKERFPETYERVPEERTFIALPLVVGERPLGAMGLSFPGPRHVDDQELEFLSTLADATAQAIDRLQALADAADRSAKLSFLAGAAAELSSSLDYRSTLANVARLAVPTLADWCAVQVVEDGDLTTLAVAHVDPAKVVLAQELSERYPPDPTAQAGAHHVARTGVSELYPEVTDEMLVAGARDEEHLRLSRELQLRSGLVVPLIARQQVLGVLTLVSAESGHRYDQSDLAFAENLAHRAAVAIDNALLYSETREASLRLQRAVSPERLEELPGWELAGVYRPAGSTEVGGDFYDAVPLEDGRLAVFMGDVMGRGLLAAASMAVVRSALRAYIVIDPSPDAVMTKLDVMFRRYDIAQLVTLVYLVVDAQRDEIALVNAGHPPPLVVGPDGFVERLPLAESPPLGLEGFDRRTLRVPFRAGATLLAFTDGLVERRGEDIDAGLERLARRAGTLSGPDLSELLSGLVARMTDTEREDDVAAIAVRHVEPAT